MLRLCAQRAVEAVGQLVFAAFGDFYGEIGVDNRAAPHGNQLGVAAVAGVGNALRTHQTAHADKRQAAGQMAVDLRNALRRQIGMGGGIFGRLVIIYAET